MIIKIVGYLILAIGSYTFYQNHEVTALLLMLAGTFLSGSVEFNLDGFGITLIIISLYIYVNEYYLLAVLLTIIGLVFSKTSSKRGNFGNFLCSINQIEPFFGNAGGDSSGFDGETGWKQGKMIMIHRLVGIVFGVVFFLVYTGNIDWFGGFQHVNNYAFNSAHGRRSGMGNVGLFAVMSVIFLVFPTKIKKFFYKRYGIHRTPLYDEELWLICGYLLALFTLGLMVLLE